MNENDSERRIAELERQLAERKPVAVPEPTNAAFPEASRSQGAYHREEVDAFLRRVEVTLRDPAAPGALTRADIDNVTFSKPPVGSFGYREGDVDLYLDRVKLELARRLKSENLQAPVRYLLYPYGTWDQQTPRRAIDVSGDAIRVIDLKTNELIGSASFGELTATRAHYGGLPVLVVDGAGLESMPITPHPALGVWRARPKSKKPRFLMIEEEWLTLVERFGLASELAEEEVAQNIGEHLSRFFGEGDSRTTTWRTFVMVAILVGVPSIVYWIPIGLLISGISSVLAVLFWRFKWEF